MDTNDNQSNYNEVFELYKLFTTPILATVDADFYAAKRFIHYIREYGFTNESAKGLDSSGQDWGQLRTITFKYYSTNSQGVLVEHQIEIPILSLIPLPILQIEKAVFDLDVRILGAIKDKPSPPPDLKSSLKAYDDEEDLLNTKIQATLTPINQNNASEIAPIMSANLKVHLVMRQADMPGGISQLLNVTQQANSGKVKPLPYTLTVDPPEILNITESPVEISVSLKNYKDEPLASKEVNTKIQSEEEWICVTPEKGLTNKDGIVVFKVHRKQLPSVSKSAELLFQTESAKGIKYSIKL
ncbi:MAG: DUF2589 domain-containing protein [Chlorobaculum sp.]|nr:DUF2589 domain-containing protein [Chlorobaculum sp.]